MRPIESQPHSNTWEYWGWILEMNWTSRFYSSDLSKRFTLQVTVHPIHTDITLMVGAATQGANLPIDWRTHQHVCGLEEPGIKSLIFWLVDLELDLCTLCQNYVDWTVNSGVLPEGQGTFWFYRFTLASRICCFLDTFKFSKIKKYTVFAIEISFIKHVHNLHENLQMMKSATTVPQGDRLKTTYTFCISTF